MREWARLALEALCISLRSRLLERSVSTIFLTLVLVSVLFERIGV